MGLLRQIIPHRLAIKGGSAFAILLAVLMAGGPVQAQSGASLLEQRVKSAYLFNFARFINWPDTVSAPGQPFEVCVLGQNPFSGALEKTLAGKAVHGRPLFPRFVSFLNEAGSCDILYISASEQNQLVPICNALSGRAILTVSDMEDFAPRCGMIGFIQEQGRIKLQINLAATRRAGLVPSSHLMKIARIIHGETR